MKSIGRFLSVLCAMGILCLLEPNQLQAQEIVNGTEQLPNSGFEDWDNLGNDSREPIGWNSFMTANASGIAASGKARRIDRVSGGRPNSKGQYCLKAFSTSIIGIIANGTLTCGRMNMGSATATDASNHNFTDRGSNGFFVRKSTLPDSLVVWVRHNPKNSGDLAQINVLIHDDSHIKDPGTDWTHVVAHAKLNPSKSSTWQRYSTPFEKTGYTSDIQYILVSITTNRTPGGGSDGDEIFVDDILLVYNPTLALGKVPVSSIGLRDGVTTQLDIPFTLSGTMSANTITADNEVIAELSDANGSFSNPIELGRITTDVSGNITATIPSSVAVGAKYRIRVRSTNYPLVSEDNGKDIEIFKGYYIEAQAAIPSKGRVSGSNTYKAGSQASIIASANPGNHFTYWSENGNKIEGVGSTYTFTVNEDRSIIANFDTNTYVLAAQKEGSGNISISPQNTDGIYTHNTDISISATADDGFQFMGFYEGSTLLSNQSPYSFKIVKERNITAKFGVKQYTLTLTSNNNNLGSVNGGGIYNFMSNASLTANPKPYCQFLAWTIGEDTISKDNPFSYTVSATQRISGIFSEIFYNVETIASPLNGGKLTGGGTFSAASTATNIVLKATAEEGFKFDKWQKTIDGSTSFSNENPLNLLSGRITSDIQCTALFSTIKYNISATASLEQGGAVSGGGIYEYKNSVNLNAVPKEGYSFIKWINKEGNTFSTEPSLSFVASSDTILTAIFQIKTYSISATSSNNSWGEVSISSPINADGSYQHFEQVTVSAAEKSGYEFRHWKTGVGGTDTLSLDKTFVFTATKDLDCFAVFTVKRKNVNINVQPSMGGSVSGGGLYEDGTSVLLQATPSTGYTFAGWFKEDGSEITTTSSYRFDITENTVLTAKFSPIPYNITLSTEGSNTNGEISWDGENYSTTISSSIPYDSTFTIYARSKTEGYKFTQWKSQLAQGVISTQSSVSYTVKGNDRISASFSNSSKEISATVKPNNSAGNVINTGNYESTYTALLEAKPAIGYSFVQWENKNGDVLGNDPILGVYVTTDSSVVAVFEVQKIELSTVSSPLLGGKTTIQKAEENIEGQTKLTALYGDNMVLSAIPSTGHIFSGWKKLGSSEIISEDNPHTFTAIENTIFVGVFDSLTYSLNIEASNQGILEGSGSYKYHSSAELKASPNTGIRFVKWLISDKDNSGSGQAPIEIEDNPYSLLIDKNFECSPVFDSILYKTTISNPTPVMGEISIQIGDFIGSNNSDTALTYNNVVSCLATASENYLFEGFVDKNNNLISTEESIDINIVSDTIVKALFSPVKMSISAESIDPSSGYVSITGGNSQDYLSEVSIIAYPAEGYQFTKWVQSSDTNKVFSTFKQVDFVLNQDTSLLAVFHKNSYYVSCRALKDGSGTVKGDSLYLFDQLATIEAYPANGYKFAYWEINGSRVSDQAVYTWNVNSTTNAVAVFEPKTYTLSLNVDPSQYGYTSGEGIYSYGDTATIEATTSTDFYFKSWHNAYRKISTENPYRLVITQDSVITANLRTDTLIVSLVSSEGGSVEGSGKYLLRSTVNIKAIPDESYEFVGWQDNNGDIISNEKEFSFVVTENTQYTAIFNYSSFDVILTDPTQGGTLVGGGKYPYMKDIVILAQSDSIHNFKTWALSGESATDPLLLATFTPEILAQPRLTYTVSKELSLEAKFDIITHNISAQASPAGTGSFTGTGKLNHGAVAVLKAIPTTHYHFAAWTLNGEVVSTNDTLSVFVDKDLDFVALFEKNIYTIKVTSYPSAGGVGSGGGSYRFGDTANISIVLKKGYEFIDWSDDQLNVLSTEISFQHAVTGSTSIICSLKKLTSNENLGQMPNGLKVFPIPSARDLFFHTEKPIKRITLYSIDGRKLFVKECSDNNTKIDVSPITSGLNFYFIEWMSGETYYGKWIR